MCKSSGHLLSINPNAQIGETASSLPQQILIHYIRSRALLWVECVLLLAVLQSQCNPRMAGNMPQHPITIIEKGFNTK
ncbi:hypothetical protein V8C35DRAFT_289331 [Trichoderma chlorosporum]